MERVTKGKRRRGGKKVEHKGDKMEEELEEKE